MRILYITTSGGTMVFFTSLIHELIGAGHSVDIATNEFDGTKPVQSCYREWDCAIYPISCSRSPLNKGNIAAIREIREIVKRGNYDIVHCHTPIAAACTRLACKSLRKNGLKVIYTAHGFHFYKGAPLKNWLVYYPIEWLCSFWTDVLVTINKEDFERAKKQLHVKRVEYVPGVGIDVAKFAETKVDRVKKRREIGVPEDAVLLVSVGELNENKNHSVVIKALSRIGNNNIHYSIAGKGEFDEKLRRLAKRVGVQDQVHLLGFRVDVNEIYTAADICVFPSIREGLGLAAVEGMACGLPLIVSDNRGTRGFLSTENAITCRYDDADAFAEAIKTVSYDKKLREKMGAANRKKSGAFDYAIINRQMKKIYGLQKRRE